MKINTSVKKLTSAFAAGALLFSQSAFLSNVTIEANAASMCTANLNKTYQKIDGFGGINHVEWYGDLTDADRAIAFENGNDQLGCTILRVYVNPDKNQWYKVLPTAQYAAKRGITIFASPWEPPASLAENGSAYGGKLHLPKRNYGAYAQHLNDFGKYMKQNGVDLYAISVQNEPDYAKEWTAWTPDETTDFIANYGDQITSTKLMSPESFQYGAYNNGKDYYSKILNNSKAFANCDIFGTHFYGTPRSKMDFPALESCGKQLWMTEVYVPDSNVDSNKWPDNLKQAVSIHDSMVVGGMQAYVVWPLRRNYSIIREDTHKMSKRGYIFAQYSKFVRPGDVRIDITEQPSTNVWVSAYKNNKNQVTIVAINNTTSGYSQQFSLGKNIIDIDRWRTSGSENLAKTDNLTIDNGGTTFWSQLPAQSVSTFVVTLEGGSTTVDPGNNNNTDPNTGLDSDGYYFHDTFEDDVNWQAHGSTEVMKSGRTPYQGSEALVVTNRTSAWMGAERSLPYAVKAGQAYSFSVNVTELDGDDTDTFYLKLNYQDASGEQHYSSIAEGVCPKGKYLQLSNTNYTIPSDAQNPVIYVETKDSTTNFYIDEAICAPAGKTLPGAGVPEVNQNNNNNNNNNNNQTTTGDTYPKNIQVNYSAQYHQIQFTWSPVQNAQNYGIAVYLAGKWRIQTQSISGSSTSYVTPKNLTPGMSYKVAIAAKVNGTWDVNNAIKNAVIVTVV
ncbi:carbohydrate binding domain-containing protein [Ruminococcus albus]|uniref:Glucuronoarabinoxylan endo-1,4-beta-xylanase n=1 Tax=Ruminococcus albus TaxID=1264 RepID=A0A1I1D4W6_RUMAL|nr:carbohydrate binding domain-containing protein [Ruminococcus albus]SFB68118.1 glucuronoarabinoxylan endo-1,4-beta-xylanase [Ruminococcus albus]